MGALRRTRRPEADAMILEEKQLASLVDMKDPDAVITEVRTVIAMLFSSFDFVRIDAVFDDVKGLFLGTYPGYRACNTEYHNLQHTTDCLLAMIRLIHGAVLEGEVFSRDHVTLGLLAALFHDTGYVQKTTDVEGTGAKYTLTHIRRSIDFMTAYLRDHAFPETYGRDGKDLLQCTGLNVKIHEIPFSSPTIEALGKILGTADLLGQMADRTYLEKLLFLFDEFKEGEVPSSSSEFEFLQKSVDFFEFTRNRFEADLGGMRRFMAPHFKRRWNLDGDPYAVAISRNQEHLRRILRDSQNSHRLLLRRGRVVEKLKERGL